jgi:hypothetical protein
MVKNLLAALPEEKRICGTTGHSRCYGAPWEREKEGNLWIMVITWIKWNLIRDLLGMS